MLTLFSVPRAFEGLADVIQRNAIQSWQRSNPGCEIVLCANDAGVDEIADEFGTRHLPDIESTDRGTPYLDAAMRAVLEHTDNEYVCFINADIILVDNLLDSIRKIDFPNFLLIGPRTNVDIRDRLDFGGESWRDQVQAAVMKSGKLDNHWGMDFFVFHRDCGVTQMPRLIVGRNFFDNWMVWRAWELGIPIIDVSESFRAVHQNHDYAHVQGGEHVKPGFDPESKLNAAVVGGRLGNCNDAGFQLGVQGLRRTRSVRHYRRRVVRQLMRWSPGLVAGMVRAKHLIWPPEGQDIT